MQKGNYMSCRALRLQFLAGALSLAAAANAQQPYPQRWNYVAASLATDEGVARFLDALEQSRKAGCTHILMPDSGWLRRADDPAYLAGVGKARAKAQDLGLEIVPVIFNMGYSGRYLGFDPNLAAGLPVRDMPFVVSGKSAVADPAAAPDVSRLAVQKGELKGILKVRPFQHYRLSFVLEGEISGDRDSLLRVSSPTRWHSRTRPVIASEGQRHRVHTTFNSLEDAEVRLSIKVGAAMLSDLSVELAGTLLLIRRDLVPLKVTSEDGSVAYREGVDFLPLKDPSISARPYRGPKTEHAPAPLVLTVGSAIRDGQRLNLSFWHTYRLGSSQLCLSTEDPKVFEIWDRDIGNCARIWNAKGYFLNYDEVRMGGWELQPDGGNAKAGEIMARHFRRAVEVVRKHAPRAQLYTWSDMFTPHHNARPFEARKQYYYLVNGNWDGAWEGLPADVIVMNWYSPKPEGLRFFADRGNRQVICGFYDARDTERLKNNIANWKRVSRGVPGVMGFMYTTWHKNFKFLAEYFELLDSYHLWGEVLEGKPEAEPGVPVQ